MIIEQSELQFEESRRATGLTVSRKMVDYLESCAEWRTRKDLNALLGITDRECRLGRQYSYGKIIFGQRGFKATKHATQDEINSCVHILMSQADEMKNEAFGLMEEHHRRSFGNAERSRETRQGVNINA